MRRLLAVLLGLPALARATCAPVPRAGCRLPTIAASARLAVTDRTPDAGDALAWTWARGADTPAAAFGDPRASDGYALCAYDAAGGLGFAADVPAAGLCGGKPCWTARPDGGFRYRNRAATPAGITQVLLQPGAAGAAKVVVRGRGVHLADRALGLPAPPLGLPLRVQLQAAPGACWEAWFATATRNQPGAFAARGGIAPTTTTTSSTTTSTLGGGVASCGQVALPPVSCTADGECPAGYACAAGLCRGVVCHQRADCPLAGECVFEADATDGTCVCWGCGAPSCPLGCRYQTFASGCRCTEESDCPPEDDVCFMGFCS